MPSSVSQKLRIKENDVLLTVNPPADFRKGLPGLPAGVKIISSGKNYHQVHWFVKNKAQVELEMDKTLKLLKDGVLLWIYYPKGSSRVQTDLSRDKGWEKLLKHDELQWISLVSFDETWSTFACRLKTINDKNKEAAPKTREIFDWVDPATKTVKLPEDISTAFKKNKKEAAFFDTLSFTNKKEYIEWIITAKRVETRTERIKGTLERLGKGWRIRQGNRQ